MLKRILIFDSYRVAAVYYSDRVSNISGDTLVYLDDNDAPDTAQLAPDFQMLNTYDTPSQLVDFCSARFLDPSVLYAFLLAEEQQPARVAARKK